MGFSKVEQGRIILDFLQATYPKLKQSIPLVFNITRLSRESEPKVQILARIWKVTRKVFINPAVGVGDGLTFYILKLAAEFNSFIVIFEDLVVINRDNS